MTANIDLLPKYSRDEEVVNSTSHFVGALFGLSTLIIFIIMGAIKGHDVLYMLPYYFYSLTMIIMFFVSGLYHSRPFHSKERAIARIIDHSDIYAFVMGTYLPLCIYGININSIKITLITIEVSFCLLGIILNVIPNESNIVKFITFFIYLVQGWIIIVFYPFNIGIPFNVFIYILIGGILYTVGSILYAIGKYKKWSHTMFHIFVLLAAITQFIGILNLLLI